MTTPTVRLYLQPGTPTTGLWCPTCLLPSAVRYPVSVLMPGPAVRSVGELTICHRHDRLQELIRGAVERVARMIGGVVVESSGGDDGHNP